MWTVAREVYQVELDAQAFSSVAKQANSPKLRALNVEQTFLVEDVVVRHGRTRWTDVLFEQEVQRTLSGNYILIRSDYLQVN